MPFQIVRNDITAMAVDAIVNAANRSLLGGGGVDGAIHRGAGPELLAECRTLGGCETGQAKLTGGYRLPARYIIHTVGPIWAGGARGEEALLRSCYRESLKLAAEHGLESVAFPLISAGAYGYPKEEAVAVAGEEIRAFLEDHEEMTVYLVVFNRQDYQISRERLGEVRAYIDQHYVDKVEAKEKCRYLRREAEGWGVSAPMSMAAAPAQTCPAGTADRAVEEKFPLDESFREMLLRKIDERGMTDAACYKKANIDRKLFNKIKNTAGYRPSKPTAVAFAVALELDLAETRELLEKAGYALSHSFLFDVIIEYYIKAGNYDVFEINDALFEYDQVLLGA